MTIEEHNKYIGYAFLAHGMLQLFIMLAMMVFMFFMVLMAPGRPGEAPPLFFGLIAGFMFVFQLVFVLPSFVASYGVLKRRSWARLASIAAGIIACLNVPLGTATCVYALWFFIGESWKTVYGLGPSKPRQLDAIDISRWTGYETDERGEIHFRPVELPDWR